ncbi:hypothetical protein MBAV_005455 [Candidatus Magnetobacterium bavaricum]|uniref:Uncharacterized protein n=1 Tax=Candidatus Magnetobacterium bavaricum TaxID=29290 RepID=A0A0F3GKK2_9BACT|nr:hypothetical protein MBAV_005455 [Candidatus Magnetobacterium bavaricum]
MQDTVYAIAHLEFVIERLYVDIAFDTKSKKRIGDFVPLLWQGVAPQSTVVVSI